MAHLSDRTPDIRGQLPLVAFVVTIGVGRTRTLTLRIKSPLCCRYTTTPCEDVRAFEPRLHLPKHNHLLCKVFQEAQKSRLEWS